MLPITTSAVSAITVLGHRAAIEKRTKILLRIRQSRAKDLTRFLARIRSIARLSPRLTLRTRSVSLVLITGRRDGRENYDEALRHGKRNVVQGFSSLRTRRGEEKREDARKEEGGRRNGAELVHQATEETVSLAEGGRDYRSWAGKPGINR